MAPTKPTRPTISTTRPTIPSRVIRSMTKNNNVLKGERKADASPTKQSAAKRSAFGDVTNALKLKINDDKSKHISTAALKKVMVQPKLLPTVKAVTKPKQNENVMPPAAPGLNSNGIQPLPNETAQKPKKVLKEITSKKVKTRLSIFEKTEESLDASGLEDILGKKGQRGPSGGGQEKMSVKLVAHQMEEQLNLGNHEVHEGVHDFDKEYWDDVCQVSHYARDIFNYLKTREPLFLPIDYMDKQVCLNRSFRSLLIDWMVEIQQDFELNHETLYLSVKLVDLYLSKVTVDKETLQLVGAAAMFIASKYDERISLLADDCLDACDDAYTRRELLRMEINLLKVCNFDLGIPLSYRFLRRYARCAKLTMQILTLARFILEYSLMDYDTIRLSDSKMAAAALFLALQMKRISGWTPTLQFYTGYKYEEIIDVVHLLNINLQRKSQLMTIRNKYSHKIFFEVAKTPLLNNEELRG